MSILRIFIFLCVAGSLVAQENQLAVAFEDLPRLIEQSSPQFKAINARLELTKFERDAALQWSNPELNFALEKVKDSGVEETEQMLFIGKTIAMPWYYWQNRKTWQSAIESAKFEQRHKVNQLLAAARNEYVQLKLLQNLKQQLAGLKGMMRDLSAAIQARHEEGAISNLEAKLLSMSLFELEADLLQTEQNHRETANRLRYFLGMSSDSKIMLTDSIGFKSVQLNAPAQPIFLQNHPGLQAAESRLANLGERIKLEKRGIVPAIALQGGYKKINPGWQGYVLGFSLPLPFFNWNRPQIEKLKVESAIQSTENAAYKRQILANFDNLIAIIQTNSELLRRNNFELQSDKIADDLRAAYEEGALSLPEFLSAIQSVRAGSKMYTIQLTEYYQAIFELETISGQNLVTF
ncbi:MAG: TolC family protein [Calditrichaeota bacterium]|nr:MAG: TolC family protein [Calditrichota bacterium]